MSIEDRDERSAVNGESDCEEAVVYAKTKSEEIETKNG